jgi:tripartite-type tricarboxylate transporter receptor subunit TctC
MIAIGTALGGFGQLFKPVNAGLNVRVRAGARVLAAACLALGAATPASAQQAWPSRPVRFIVPFPAGGSTMEQVVRLLTQDMPRTLGQAVVIESKPGAGTVIGVDAAAKSTDGHTFVGVANSFTVNQTLMKTLPYDTLKDLKPVVLMARTANVFAARPGIPVSSLKELVAYAKANPGKLSYASFGNGTTAHFAGEMFKTMAGIDMVHVPYKGQGPALTDLLGGQVDVMFGNLPDFLPHVRSGKLKALGTTFLTRVPQAPDIPTIAEQGYPKFETDSWYGILAPAATPKEVVARMNAEFNKVLADPAIRKGMDERGLEPIGGSIEKFGAHISGEIAKYEQVVKQSNMKID